MTRTEMIKFIKENHFVHITHPLFTHDEYIFSVESGNVYDEKGYLFEDWFSTNDFSGWNGIRTRVKGKWEDGWYIKE